MIEYLRIKNLALIQDAEVEFKSGLNIISGETGAGKSVLINALSLLFGDRADKSIIRTGETRCELNAILKIPDYTVNKLNGILEEYSIPPIGKNNELLLRRIITPNSSRQFVNDSNVSLNILDTLGDLLIDFHRPNQHLLLLKNNTILDILDSFGKLIPLRNECEKLYNEIKLIDTQLTELKESIPNENEIEYLKHLITAITKVNPQIDEDLTLNRDYNVASNSKNIIETTSQIKSLLYDSEESIYNTLGSINKKLSNIAKMDPEKAEDFVLTVTNISSQVKDLSYILEGYAAKIELDDEEFAKLETRLNSISSLKRHYGPTLNDVLEKLRSAQEKLNLYENSSAIINSLSEKSKDTENTFLVKARELTEKRKKVSELFIIETKNKLKPLGFFKAEMAPVFTTTQISPSGMDKFEIMFSANPGENLHPLNSVVSSGELSRVMLAIKSVLSTVDKTPILVFDEIDANIGGEVAKEVGKELKKIGKNHQTICISHLPQVASFADHHFQVSKNIVEGRTITTILALSDNEKIVEISRMLGGGKAAKMHAENIIKNQETNNGKTQS